MLGDEAALGVDVLALHGDVGPHAAGRAGHEESGGQEGSDGRGQAGDRRRPPARAALFTTSAVAVTVTVAVTIPFPVGRGAALGGESCFHQCTVCLLTANAYPPSRLTTRRVTSASAGDRLLDPRPEGEELLLGAGRSDQLEAGRQAAPGGDRKGQRRHPGQVEDRRERAEGGVLAQRL